ncbi:hypothetical protein BSKO_12953 [Bryopsis sp. KO-2023]|nr:hypothetical protein BSKO_12953 [Bryopsis sp. KO-2023]
MQALQHREQYAQMEATFAQKGFNTAGIEAIRKFYGGLGPDETPEPLRYVNLPEKLPVNSVRLLVIPLEEFETLTLAIGQLTRAVIELLPAGTKVFINPRALLHITLFHASHPSDPRPDPAHPTGGCDIADPPSARPAPQSDALLKEQQTLKQIVNSANPPQLAIHGALMADSGTLLLTWTDGTDNIKQVREAACEAFPGRPTRQTGIVHSSLFRLLDPVDLDKATLGKICQLCKDWSSSWAGKVFVPSLTWFVYEDTFSIVNGERFVFKFEGGGEKK